MKVHFLKTILTCFVLLLFNSCDQQGAILFNERIVEITDSLNKKGLKWHQTFQNLKDNHNVHQLSNVRKEFQSYLEKQIEVVREMKDVAGSEDFKRKMLDYLNYQKQMVLEGLMPFEKNQNLTEEERSNLQKKFEEMISKEQQLLINLKSAQTEFSRKNNFKVIDNQ